MSESAEIIKTTKLQGYYTNEDDEQVQVEFDIKGLDATYEEIDTNQSSGKRIKDAAGGLKMTQDIVRRDWAFLKWFSSKNSQ